MKTRIVLLTCFLLFAAPLLASPAKELQMQETSVTISENGSPLNHTVTIRYEENRQASIRNLELLLFKVDRETKKGNILLLKGTVRNLLSRDLVNAKVVVSYLNKDGELLASEQRDILPHRLNRKDNGRPFSVETNYTEKISLIEITVNWQGKAE